MAESDELSPLIQRHVTASAAELRAEAAAQMQLLKSELKGDIQEINQRSLRMEAQLQELISRSSDLSVSFPEISKTTTRPLAAMPMLQDESVVALPDPPPSTPATTSVSPSASLALKDFAVWAHCV